MTSVTISIDVGGTFTDIVVNRDGRLDFYKSLSDHHDIPKGIFQGLQHVAEDLKVSLTELLSSCRTFSCGTTAATNAILEKRTARIAVLCTKGFRDVLRIRQNGKLDSHNIFQEFPEPFVPRELTFPITERVNAEGGVEIALDEAEARNTLEQIRNLGVEAIAVALLWSIANPAHELRLAELIREVLPNAPFSLSHQVSPSVGEYGRTSATALDAALKPVMRDTVVALSARLFDVGFKGEPLFVCSNGGRASASEILQRPVVLCLSGPSAAPGAAVRLASRVGIDNRNVISIDLGGTSLDACLVVDGVVEMKRQGEIAGHVFGVPSVDIVTIASGGGSIARVDLGGMLHVGPESAGSLPGPACYGRGGLAATLTDANLVRELLNPKHFGGGLLQLDLSKAWTAIEGAVAIPLGVSVPQAACLVAAVAEQNMLVAIEDMIMRKGLDPRDFALVSGGAAGGLHAARLAAHLGIETVLVPRAGSVMSAYGIATSDLRYDASRILPCTRDSASFPAINSTLDELAFEGTDFLVRMKVPSELRQLRFFVEARYLQQVWQIQVPFEREDGFDEKTLGNLESEFHRRHEDIYAVSSPGEVVEFVEWRLEATGLYSPEHTQSSTWENNDRPPGQASTRHVYLDDGNRVALQVYDAARLNPGHQIDGPAIVEYQLTSTLVPNGAWAVVTDEGGMKIQLARGKDQAAAPS